MLSQFFFYGSSSLFLLRVALAAIFIVHGWHKIRDLKVNAENFNNMGFRPGKFWGTIVALLEFFGGISYLFGFLVPFLSVFYALQFITIIPWKISRKTSFTGTHGWELDLIILAAVIAIFFLGSGAYALDHMFFFGL